MRHTPEMLAIDSWIDPAPTSAELNDLREEDLCFALDVKAIGEVWARLDRVMEEIARRPANWRVTIDEGLPRLEFTRAGILALRWQISDLILEAAETSK